MESCQILWKTGWKDRNTQSGVGKKMKICNKYPKSMKKLHMSTPSGASKPNGTRRPTSVTSCKSSLKFPPRKSFGSVNGRLATSMQVVGHQLNPGQVDLSPTLKKRVTRRRPHTSLGFAWKRPSAVDPLGPPQGFDIAGYVKSRGTAQGIQIGINGRPVNDEYFQSYLEKCERDGCFDDSEEVLDLNYLDTVSKDKQNQGQGVPLCWEDQLKIVEPECILPSDCSKPEKKCTIIYQQPRTSQGTPHKTFKKVVGKEDKLVQIASKTSVILSWRERCILNVTTLSELNPSLIRQSSNASIVTEKRNDSKIVSSSNRIPCYSAEEGSAAITLGKLVEWLQQNTGSTEQKETTCSFDIMSEHSCEDLLCVWFKTDTIGTQKMLVKMSFEVFVTATETVDQNLVELSTKSFTKLHPRIVSSTVLVIPIHLCGGESVSDFVHVKSKELKLTVVCHEPRSLLFSTLIHLTSEPDLSQNPPILSEEKNSTMPSTAQNPMKHHVVGSLDVPEPYCRRRTSYCNQDEDEDKVDLEALTRLFPDLKILEYQCEDSLSGNGHPREPASLPVCDDELIKLNSIAVNIRRIPAPNPSQTNGSACYYGTANRTPHTDAIFDTCCNRRDISRPLFRPVTPQDVKATHNQQSHTSYTSIVNHWLTPYMK